jgi:hypothetical protein
MRRLIFAPEHSDFCTSIRRPFQSEIAPHEKKMLAIAMIEYLPCIWMSRLRTTIDDLTSPLNAIIATRRRLQGMILRAR